MGFYEFLQWNLAWMVTVAVLWPVNIPLAALAYKVRQGAKPIEMEPSELWTRCTFATLFSAAGAAALVLLDYYLARNLLPGPIHLVVTAAFVAGAWWLFFVMFALDDPFEGLSLFLLYLYMPIAVLYVINKVVPVWTPVLNYAGTWLKPP